MTCDHNNLRSIPLFSLLSEEEAQMLANSITPRLFSKRERIYSSGDTDGCAFVVTSGKVRVSIQDEDGQEVVIDEPAVGDFFGFASMLDNMPHRATAVAVEATSCLEISRENILSLIQAKPNAGLGLMTVMSRHYHATQDLVRLRATRNANVVFEEKETVGGRISDAIARFGGSWSFILSFGFLLTVYVAINIAIGSLAWDPYPFILLNLFLSLVASMQAPIIMMSQNRQDAKDRLRSELDFEINRRAESEIQSISRKLWELEKELALVSGHLRKLVDEKMISQK